ncbi:hypothetical protein FB451DRAFT_1489651, partial [Mycena latifolia]
PPKEGRLLYTACIGPHFISGADIIDDVALAHLEKVQNAFLRRLLGLGPYSMRAPLFTELGLISLRYRRLISALRYLGYVVRLALTHYARIALGDAYDLYVVGHKGYGALYIIPSDLKTHATTHKLPEGPSRLEIFFDHQEFIGCSGPPQGSHQQSMCQQYLLHGRREPLEDERAKKIIVILRHYLTLVVNAAHRKSLTRLIVSQHLLAVERMRSKIRYHREDIPREHRLCRFGCGTVETAEHALFFCDGTEALVERRNQFVASASTKEPRLQEMTADRARAVLRDMIFRCDTVCRIAKYVDRVFAIFDRYPLVWPE